MEDKKELSFWDIGCELECAIAGLEETSAAFDVLYELLERHGFQCEEKFDPALAILFAQNFPRYLATMNIIRRELDRNIAEIQASSDKAYEAHNAHKSATIGA